MAKYRIVAHTPLGKFKSKPHFEEDEYAPLEKIIKDVIGYFTFINENDELVILKEDVVMRSVFVIEKVE